MADVESTIPNKEIEKLSEYQVRNVDESFFQLPIGIKMTESRPTGTTSIHRGFDTRINEWDVLVKVTINQIPKENTVITFINPYDLKQIWFIIKKPMSNINLIPIEKRPQANDQRASSVYVERVFTKNDEIFKDKQLIQAEVKIENDKISLNIPPEE